MRTLLLIIQKVLWLGLSVNVKYIHKLKKYPKIAPVFSVPLKIVIFCGLLIIQKVLWLGLSVNVKYIHKLEKYPKIAQVLSLKVHFLTSERYDTPVPHIFEFGRFCYFWLKIYFFYFVRCMFLHHLSVCLYFGENFSGWSGIVDQNSNF